MEDADHANEVVLDADDVGVAEPAQHQDDETDSSDEEEEEEDANSSDFYYDDDDYDDDDDVPKPEEVELEYTFPQDFEGSRSWRDVVAAGQFFRLLIDPSCTGIPKRFFKYCKYLIEIVYPEGKDSKLLRIGKWAFRDCCNLQRMNPFPDGLVELGDMAFMDGWKLQGRITIPPSIQLVGRRCFMYCKSITSVVFESSTATTTVLELKSCIFRCCEELLSVTLPNTLRVIPRYCFRNCRSLIDVPIPGSVRTIQYSAFSYCDALSAVDLPESVIAIDEKAYYDCPALLRVTIRSSTNALQVGRKVFKVCPSLSTIKVYPWQFPKIFAAMTDDPSFLYKFFHQYHHQIVDEEAEVGMVTRQHRNGRRRRKQRPPQKKQRLQGG